MNFVAQGFTPGQGGQVRLDDTVVAVAPVGPDGRAQGSFTVPQNTSPGSHSVTFTTPADGAANATVQVGQVEG